MIHLVFTFFAAPAESLPASTVKNYTTIGTTSSNPQVYCEPSTWWDICWFVFTNYVLHALSVRSLAGENEYSSTVFKLCCLLVPYAGLRRGLCLISRASNLAGSDLQGAARANALCMVIRKCDWRPKDGETVNVCCIDLDSPDVGDKPASRPNYTMGKKTKEWFCKRLKRTTPPSKPTGRECHLETEKRSSSVERENGNTNTSRKTIRIKIQDLYSRPPCQSTFEKLSRKMIETTRFSNHPPSSNILDHESVKIQGFCEMPPGYALSYVPGDMKIYPRYYSRMAANTSTTSISSLQKRRPTSKTRIASAHNFPRILFSITQTVSGGYSLFKARGSQIERYGYAAFGLTVVPYIVISIVNLIGSLLTSEYETVYLVHSSIMDEMIERGGKVDGVVGSIDVPPGDEKDLFLTKGEERIEFEGKNIKFEFDDNDTVRCHSLDAHAGILETYYVSPYEPPKPVSKPKQNVRLPKWCKIPYWMLSSRKPPEDIGGPNVSIPSYPAFTQLSRSRYQTMLDLLCMFLALAAISAPYIVISVLTRWKANDSSSVQQNFTLTWIVCGQIQGYMVGNIEILSARNRALKGLLIVFICYGSYFLSGFYVVAQEMLEFGICKAI